MSSATDNPTEAARRLEHALERIALAMANSIAAEPAPVANAADAAQVEEVKARLDSLIGKLRAGLAETPR